MNENSTFLFIMDIAEGKSEFIDIDEMLDPYGKCSIALERTFKNISLSPRQEVITKILMHT